MAMRPRFLLLDEPSAGLDPEGVADLLTALTRLESYGTTIALATHDVELAMAWADEAIVMFDGQATQGPASQLLSDADLLTKARLRMPWPIELARRLGLHKSTASRLLATLEKRGLVEQDDETGKYRLEFRHPSWLDEAVFERLRARNLALCIADSDDRHTPVVATARSAGRAIVETAIERHSEVIVLGSQGKRRIGDRVFGRTIDHVLNNLPCEAIINVIPKTTVARTGEGVVLASAGMMPSRC